MTKASAVIAFLMNAKNSCDDASKKKKHDRIVASLKFKQDSRASYAH